MGLSREREKEREKVGEYLGRDILGLELNSPSDRFIQL